MSKHLLSGWGLSVVLEGSRLRAVRMELGSPTPVLGEARVVELPDGAVEDGMIRDVEAVRSALAGVMLEAEFKKLRKVVFSVCSTQVVSEVVSVPPMSEKKLAKLLAANSDMYFPVDVSDCHLTWQVVGQTVDEDGHDALSVRLWAVPNALLRRYYAVANECGLSVAAIDYAGNSVASAVGAGFAAAAEKKASRKAEQSDAAVAVAVAEDEPDEVYLLLEAEHLMMTFVHAGEVRMQRLLLRGADGDELSEARFALEYYTSQPRNSARVRLTACGAEALDADYVRRAGEALDGELAVLESGVGCEWCLCAGAGMTELDFGDVSFDRKPRRNAAQQAWQWGVLLAGALVLVGVLVVNFGSRLVWDSTLDGLESNRRALELQSAQNAGNAKNYYEYSDLYDNYSSDWDTLFASLRTYNDNLVLMLDELETVLPKQTSVVTIGIANEGMGLQFACSSKEEAAYLIIALRQLEYADLISISDLTIGSTNSVTGPSMLPSLAAKLEAEEQARQEQLAQLAAAQSGEETAPEKGSIDVSEFTPILTGGSIEPEKLLKEFRDEGVLDEKQMIKAISELEPEERHALFEAYAEAAPEVKKYTLDELIDKATFAQRKSAMTAMLTENETAFAEFYFLLDEDMGRPRRNEEAILCDSDFNSEFFFNDKVMAAFGSGTLDMKGIAAEVASIVTKSNERLERAEKLIKTDPNVSDWYAYYLALELPKVKMDRVKDAGKLDMDEFAADIVYDLMFGTKKDIPHLEDALENIRKQLDENEKLRFKWLDGSELTFSELRAKVQALSNITGGGSSSSGSSSSGSIKDLVEILGGGSSSSSSSSGSTSSSSGVSMEELMKLLGTIGGTQSNNVGSDALNQLINNGILGGTQSQPTQQKDDRIYFAVALGYKQTLIDAELERKGLSAAEKLEKLEVSK